MKTVFDVVWPVASSFDVAFIFVLVLLLVLAFVLVMYYTNLKKKQAQEQQYFLYKTKQLGLTTAQTKMLNSIIVMISLRNLRRMLTESSLFESAIKSFLEYLTRQGETGESLQPVCRDVAITHEKLYHPATYRKPLDSLTEIEKNTMVYFHDERGRCFIGKVGAMTERTSSCAWSTVRRARPRRRAARRMHTCGAPATPTTPSGPRWRKRMTRE